MIHAEHENVTRPVWTREATMKAIVLIVFNYAFLIVSTWSIHGMYPFEPFRLRDLIYVVIAAVLLPFVSIWTASPARRPFEDQLGFIAGVAAAMIGAGWLNQVPVEYILMGGIFVYLVGLIGLVQQNKTTDRERSCGE